MQNLKILAITAIGLLFLAMTGCATVLRGTEQKMTFNTEPEGATVVVDDVKYTTPAVVKLKRKKEHTVLISKEGYRTVKFSMKAEWDGASLISLALPGGSIMFATDTASGADRSLPYVAKMKLQPVTDPNTPPLELVQHRSRMMTPDEYKKALEDEKQIRHDELFER